MWALYQTLDYCINFTISISSDPLFPLVIQEERAVGNAADQMAALVGLEVAQRPHGVHYTIISHNPTTRTPPLGSDPNAANLRTGQLHETTLEV